jgi:nucleoside-diphosphate-sugar epimerase
LSADKDIVYSCVGFSRYEAKYWNKHWPIVVENLLAASNQRTGQKLVFCDNLYAYGPATNISPLSHTVAPSKKTEQGVRAIFRKKFEERIAENPNSITIVGGANFFGPYVTNTSFLGDTFTKAIVQGKPAPICIGSASVIHDFAFAPDFSGALYLASIHGNKANGKFWVCPHSIRNKTLTQIANDVARLAASRNSKVTVYPGWSVRLLSPFIWVL